MNKKNCIFCNSSNVKKNGHRRNIQMYLCKDCDRQFQGGRRINNYSLWNDYLTANQTILDLSTLHKCSERTIRRRLSLVVDSFTTTYPKSAVIILDTTYFS
jgi:Insertion element protein.